MTCRIGNQEDIDAHQPVDNSSNDKSMGLPISNLERPKAIPPLQNRRAFIASLGGAVAARANSVGAVTLPPAPPPGVGTLTDTFSEVALSPDGRYLAVNLFLRERPDDLAIIDLHQRTGWFLRGNKRGFLTQPAFSPDGRSLAVVWTPPPYWNETQIWITTPRGGRARAYGEPGRAIRFPSFSPDGRRMVTFRDAITKPAPAHAPISAFPVRNRLYEIDLTSGSGQFLGESRFRAVFRTAYDPLGRGVFFWGFGILVPNYLSPHDPDVMVDGDWQPDYDRKYGFPRNYLWRHDRSFSIPPEPYAPAAAVGISAAFQGVTRTGEVLLTGVRSGQGVVELFDGQETRIVAPAHGDTNSAVITPKGDLIVTTGLQLPQAGQGPLDPSLKLIRLIDVPTGKIVHLRASEITFSNTYSIQEG